MKLEDPQDIGLAAGEVFRYLHQNGPSPISRIKKELELGSGQVDQGVGWLARENKLSFLKDKRTVLIAVRGDAA